MIKPLNGYLPSWFEFRFAEFLDTVTLINFLHVSKRNIQLLQKYDNHFKNGISFYHLYELANANSHVIDKSYIGMFDLEYYLMKFFPIIYKSVTERHNEIFKLEYIFRYQRVISTVTNYMDDFLVKLMEIRQLKDTPMKTHLIDHVLNNSILFERYTKYGGIIHRFVFIAMHRIINAQAMIYYFDLFKVHRPDFDIHQINKRKSTCLTTAFKIIETDLKKNNVSYLTSERIKILNYLLQQNFILISTDLYGYTRSILNMFQNYKNVQLDILHLISTIDRDLAKQCIEVEQSYQKSKKNIDMYDYDNHMFYYQTFTLTM